MAGRSAHRTSCACRRCGRADDDLAAALGDGWYTRPRGGVGQGPGRGRGGHPDAARRRPRRSRSRDGRGAFDGAGRWVEADLPAGDRLLTVVSAYVHTGRRDGPAGREGGLPRGRAPPGSTPSRRDGRHVLLTGDLNVAHREADLKNWKGNLKKAGFLPQERAWFDRLFGDGGWVDVVRALSGEGPGPYSWWSWRGKAFDLDSGWRIDYQIASAGLGGARRQGGDDRAPSYAERWSDHAPVVVRYDVTAAGGEGATTRSRPECLAS